MTKKTINEAPEKLLPGQKEIADKILRKDLEDNRKRRLDNEQAGVPAALRRAMETRREKKNDNSLTTDKDFNTSLVAPPICLFPIPTWTTPCETGHIPFFNITVLILYYTFK